MTDSSFCVSWHITDSLPCDTIFLGNISYRKVGSPIWIFKGVTYTSSNTVTFCDTASSCTQYEWRVKNKCKHGDTSYFSDWVTGPDFYTKCDTATCCKVPDSLTVVSTTDSSFCVSWHITDSIPCDTIFAGNISYRKVGSPTWIFKGVSYTSGNTVTFCDTASSCTQYEWRVKNNCKFRDSSFFSDWITGPKFTTKCDTSHFAKTGPSLHVFPNPANSSISISTSLAGTSNVLIVVTDIYGTKKLERRVLAAGKNFNSTLDISGLPKGMYFVTVSDGKRVSKASFLK